jgi:hypothetical protein
MGKVFIVDGETGEQVERDETAEEIAARESLSLALENA